jgi:hypothetical protein
MTALAGLLVAADAPTKDDPTKRAKDTLRYAKVEVQGVLTSVHEDWEPMYIDISAPSERAVKIPLMVAGLKGWTERKLLGANGRVVRLTGTLERRTVGVRPGVTEERLVIVANTLEVVAEDIPPLPKEP